MSRFASRIAYRIMKRDNGSYDGEPRMYNVTRNTYSYGYVEVNQQASSTFSRIKSHKAWFSGDADVKDGDLLIDRVSGNHYLAMSIVPEYSGGVNAYLDGTLFYANTTCAVERFDAAPAKSAFGKAILATPGIIASYVWIMVQTITLDVVEKPDQTVAKEKIKVAVQNSVGIKVNDRLVTALGDNYKVVSVDRCDIDGLDLLFVDKDIR